jgi:hypothetical protein
MRKFNDSEGREWSIAVNIGSAKRLKDQLQIDLLDPASLQRLSDSPYDVANALFVLCEAQAKATTTSEEQFGAALSGDAIEEATDALMLEIVDFFPKRQRDALKTLLAKMDTAKQGAATLAQEKVNSPAMDQAIQRAMTQAGTQIDQLLAKVGESSGAASGSPA